MKKAVVIIPVALFLIGNTILSAEIINEKAESAYEVKDSTQLVEDPATFTGVGVTPQSDASGKSMPSWTREFAEQISITPKKKESEKLLSPIKSAPPPSRTVRPATDNFIRLNMEKNGQKMEIQIDPLAVDAYIDIKYDNTAPEEKKTSEADLDESTEKLLKKKITPKETEEEVPEPKDEPRPKKPVDDRVKDVVDDLDGGKKATMTEKVLNHMMKAQKLFYEGDYENALEEAKSAVRAERTASGYSLLGSIYYMLEDTAGATAAWEKALKIDPDLQEVREVLEYMK